VLPRAFHLIDCQAADPEVEAARFASLLRERPLDILCQGIGSSGHLALNEPGATDFNDSAWVRVVAVAEQSKQQLRADPGFRQLGSIPDRGLTMTIPALLSARFIYTMVPLALKKAIMTRLLGESNPTKQLPASILSTVEGTLFVDQESCPDVLKT
jgi:glucosamine-6-phosphate deaminase